MADDEAVDKLDETLQWVFPGVMQKNCSMMLTYSAVEQYAIRVFGSDGDGITQSTQRHGTTSMNMGGCVGMAVRMNNGDAYEIYVSLSNLGIASVARLE